ncbi:phage tail protein [Klebsiella pneumoniae]|uniref:portal protein n=1 Tax=Klebsiella pneumoniae TaxID=573 RepID=UPI000C7AD8B3|nr:portal protein [Klebsiella pneumoniae]PLH37802.1 phage tail protein [Klebsiella pneumoniae]PLI25509.1 phage tail protein [Klebsiella pneumoniae]UZI88657.1 portal protein [Klebsiella pneumoniae]HBR1726883.1 head-tail connector protein [Klebsiella pneumoniae]HBZ1548184.1 phage tail protein [Klebsiella pneumoniae]
MDQLASRLIRRADTLKANRQVHESLWRECYDYTYPLRGAGFSSEVLDAQSAKHKVAKLLDGTATDSARMLASALMSGMTPANAQWLNLDSELLPDDAKAWLSTCATLVWENIHAANFDAEGYEANLDVVCAGWFALYVDEDKEEGGFTFQQWPLAQCFVTSTRRDGIVDTIYRCYQLTAEQAVKEFGADKVSEKIRDAAKNKPDDKFDFLHCIFPRDTYAVNAKLARNMRFASFNVEVSGKRIVRESGYHEFPVCVPRWMKIPGGSYGIGPVYDALPDCKELNETKRMEKAAQDLAISGMWIAEDDGVLNPRTVKVGPRRIIVANSTESMKPLLTGADFNVAFTAEERLQASIRKIMMADQLQPQDGPAMTATEVHVRVALIRQLLGPVYGRFQAEYLQPLVERCFGIAFRAGVFPPAPESLQSANFNVRYISPLARAQKLEDVTAIERYGQNIMQLAQAYPDVLDNMDSDEASKVVGEALGVPAKVMRSADAVEQLRQQRQQMQQQQAQQQMLMQAGTEAAGAAGQTAGAIMGQRLAGNQ